MFAAALGLILTATKDAAKQLLQTGGIKQAVFDMVDHHVVELVHGDRSALAAGLALPRLDRAGIVAIAAALAGADGHGSAAVAAIADAGQQGRPDHHTRGQLGLGVSGLQKTLNGVEGLPLDDGGYRDDDDLVGSARVVVLAALAPFDGVMLGHAGAPYHFEFTKAHGPTAGPAPTRDNLLVFYLPDPAEWQVAVERMEGAGFRAVAAFNPYWDRSGRTFEDPDGYRVVIQRADWHA